MSAQDEKDLHSCSSVPPVGDGTAEHGKEQRNSAGTGAEQTSLQALALGALKRNTERNSTGTNVFHPAPEKGPNVPPVFHDRMPDSRQLEMICRRACADFPSVPADRLLAFLNEAQDPAWCTERAARQLAKRMHEGLIVWRPGQ